MWKLHEIPIAVPTVLLEQSHAHYTISKVAFAIRGQSSIPAPCRQQGPQSLKYLLPGPLQKVLAAPFRVNCLYNRQVAPKEKTRLRRERCYLFNNVSECAKLLLPLASSLLAFISRLISGIGGHRRFPRALDLGSSLPNACWGRVPAISLLAARSAKASGWLGSGASLPQKCWRNGWANSKSPRKKTPSCSLLV